MNREPVAIIAAIEVLLVAVLTLVSLEAGWSADRTAAVHGIVTAAVLVAGSIWARSKVTPAG